MLTEATDKPAGSGLQAVFLENRTSLLRFLRARGAADAAEDLLHELWIRVSSGVSAPVSDPLAYLYKAANNLMLDRYRAEVRRGRREQDWTDMSSDAATSHSPERLTAAREQLRAAEAALSQLGERTETIFKRFRLDGATQVEIANELGISLSAVEKHLQKAYRALVECRRLSDAE